MKKLSILSIIPLFFAFTTLSLSKWTMDDAHSNLRFSVTHLMVAEIEGSIKLTKASLTTPNEDFTDATVTLEADMTSIDTDNEGRDNHLKSKDFFSVDQFPTMTFTSETFKKIDDKKYVVTGPLTFHGITKNVMLDVVANPGVQPWDNKVIVGFKVSGKILRSDYDISPSTPSAVLSDEVEIIANVIFGKD